MNTHMHYAKESQADAGASPAQLGKWLHNSCTPGVSLKVQLHFENCIQVCLCLAMKRAEVPGRHAEEPRRNEKTHGLFVRRVRLSMKVYCALHSEFFWKAASRLYKTLQNMS